MREKKDQDGAPAHERLYKTAKDPATKTLTARKNESEKEKSPEFVPRINEKSKKITRSSKVEEILLDDAKRRLTKRNEP